MASALNILDDIDDRFCQCCLCFEQYRDPRQLPCLHRFCTGCLKKLTGKNKKKLACPLCKEVFDIPANGVNGWKKDFYMAEIIDYLRVKKSLKEDIVRSCGVCSTDGKSTAYCFKCYDFLCDMCHGSHLTDRGFEDHIPHLLTLKGIDNTDVSLEKLGSLSEAPRCQSHPDNVSHLCCKSCSNLPICNICIHGEHQDHDFKDVISLANTERERLSETLASMNAYRDAITERVAEVQETTEGLIQDADRELSKIKSAHDRRVAELEAKRASNHEKMEHAERTITDRHRDKILKREKEMEERMNEIRWEFQRLKEQDRLEFEAELDASTATYAKEENAINLEDESSEKEFQESCSAVQKRKEKALKGRDDLSQGLVSIISQLEHLTATGSSILSSNNSWRIVHSVGDICHAAEPLLRDMKEKISEKTSDIESTHDAFGLGDNRVAPRSSNTRFPNKVETFVMITGHKAEPWYANAISCNRSADIFLSGGAGEGKSFLSVINMKGFVSKYRMIQPKTASHPYPPCYCAPYKQCKVVTTCFPDEISMFDLRDSSHSRRNLRDVIGGRSPGQELEVRCLTTDDSSSRIIVGCYTRRSLYLLDGQFSLRGTVELPKMIQWPQGIAVRKGHLLVCDPTGKRACAVTIGGELAYEFPKPRLSSQCERPCSVCTDTDGNIYILWREQSYSCEQNCALVLYSHDGCSPPTEIALRTDGIAITVVEMDKVRRLLVATFKSRKMYVLNLNTLS